MPRVKLDIQDTFDFSLIGISCHEKDYRLCWGLNHYAGFNFARIDDLPYDPADPASIRFPLYEFADDDHFKTYQLLANRFGNQRFLPEMDSIDFLFIVRGEATEDDMEQLMERIHRVDFVILASELDVTKIKSRENLLFF